MEGKPDTKEQLMYYCINMWFNYMQIWSDRDQNSVYLWKGMSKQGHKGMSWIDGNSIYYNLCGINVEDTFVKTHKIIHYNVHILLYVNYTLIKKVI